MFSDIIHVVGPILQGSTRTQIRWLCGLIILNNLQWPYCSFPSEVQSVLRENGNKTTNTANQQSDTRKSFSVQEYYYD